MRIVGLGWYGQTKAQADAVLKIVASLPALKELTLEDCNSDLDFTPLAALDGLDVLAYRNSYDCVSDLSAVLQVPGWTELALDCELEVSMEPLAKLPRLEKLDWMQYDPHGPYGDKEYTGNPPDLSPLAEMPQLRALKLDIWMDSPDFAVDLSPLAEMPGLRSLELEFPWRSSDFAVDLSLLAEMRGLRELTLTGCKTDFLAHMLLPQVEMLGIHYDVDYIFFNTDTRVGFDTKLLAAVPNLRELSLSSTPDTDLSPLANMTKLERLHLDGIPPKDFTPLLGMKQLRYINLFTEFDFIDSHEDLWFMLHEALPDCEVVMVSGLDC